MSDLDPAHTVKTAEYYLAQYFLAPRVIEESTEHPLVIANFHTQQSPELYQSRGLELAQDFGNGLLLLRRTKR
jgi:hypothetical protein